jgi:FAD/FMN-containing dehydrogenase
MALTDELTLAVAGPVLAPGDDGYADEVETINRSIQHAPEIVVGPTSAADVQAAVRFAAARALPIGVLNTGHGQAQQMHGGLLITTRRMTGVRIDPEARTARVEAGVRWRQVVDAAAAHGLAPLSGSSETVGVVGYTLGGGLSVTMGRAHGWAADQVRAIDVVTADGELHHATPEDDQDLFWALRGGKSNFGVVTALEFGLFPVTRLYAGALFFAGEQMAQVLDAYRQLSEQAPDELMSSVALVRMPAAAPVPEFMRGRLTVSVRISYLGDASAGERLVAPLRAVAPPLADTVADRPYTEFNMIDPGPGEAFSSVEQFMLLRELSPATVDAFVAAAGPDADTDLMLVDIRQLGGALTRPQGGASTAAGPIADAAFMVFAITPVPPGEGELHTLAGSELGEQLRPWLSERRHANFLAPSAAAPEATRTAFDDPTYARLQTIKAAVDPDNLFRLNHNIPPSDPD